MKSTQQSATAEESAIDDSTFSVLADARRRALVRCLRSADEPIGVADLASDIAARERDTEPRDVSEEIVERVYVTLHHIHLPKLADEGYLRYDEDQTSVVLTDEADSLVSILEWAAQQN